MRRAAGILLHLVIATIVALVLLGALLRPGAGTAAGALGEAARRLFLFMDIGLGVWVILLVIASFRPWGTAARIAAAAVAVVVNLATVVVVGFVQQGDWPVEFIGWALEAGVAFLLGAAAASILIARVKARLASGGSR